MPGVSSNSSTSEALARLTALMAPLWTIRNSQARRSRTSVPSTSRPQALDERGLDDVLGPRLAGDPAGVAQQRAPVALDDRLEGPLGPERGEAHETLVGLGAEQDCGELRTHGGSSRVDNRSRKTSR